MTFGKNARQPEVEWPRIWTRDYREQIQLAVREGLELGASELKAQSCNRLSTLPPLNVRANCFYESPDT